MTQAPLQLANEGRCLLVVAPEDLEVSLSVLEPLGGIRIGEVRRTRSATQGAAAARVLLRTPEACQTALNFPPETRDTMLCADRANVRDVLRIAPAARRDRVALLLDWAGVEAEGEVPDPYTGGPEDFRQVWRLVDSAAQAVVARLAAG